MYQYNDEQLNELKKFRNKYPGDKINAVCDIIEKILETDSKRKDVINEVAVKYKKSMETIYYWLRQYQNDGIMPLLEMESIAIKLVKRDGRPIGEWNKRLLYTYLNMHAPEDDEYKITFSQTFCWDFLKKLKNNQGDGTMEKTNKLYIELKRNDCDFIFIDYIKLPPKPKSLTLKVRYVFVIFVGKDTYIKRVTIDRATIDRAIIEREDVRWDSPFITSFEKLIIYLKDDKDLINTNTYLILKDDYINREIIDVFKDKPYNVNILIGNISGLHDDLKKIFVDIDNVKKTVLEKVKKNNGSLPKRMYISSRRLEK